MPTPVKIKLRKITVTNTGDSPITNHVEVWADNLEDPGPVFFQYNWSEAVSGDPGVESAALAAGYDTEDV